MPKAGTTTIRTDRRAGERAVLDKRWRTVFLDTLAETSNVTAAAAAAGVNPARAYKVRRHEDGFRRQWNAALLEGYEHLELETLQRLRDGTAADGPRFDIANALRLLALHRDSAAREQARRADADEEAVLATLTARLDRMRAREDAAMRLLAAPGTGTEAGAGTGTEAGTGRDE